ncbi:hypothetical protein NBH15_25400 [Parabacteroides sp. W1-Q-101]|uniref:hypothetical protein n=1 Tax=Parabacteroides TaxID=375288 RepID=UPI002030B3C7|nr:MULTISPECIES: hypothetical protein [Parabacteroides]MCM0721592.1 hypothetical protein [Parabacteroides sp. W1-Q-101]
MATTAKSAASAQTTGVQGNAAMTVSKNETVKTEQTALNLSIPPAVTVTEQQPSKVDFSALMEKTDKLAALKEKYQELTGKRKSLDLFAISHDNQNAQIQIVDAKGQSFESSNPKCIKEVIDIWMKDFAKAIEETEKEIRNLYAC